MICVECIGGREVSDFHKFISKVSGADRALTSDVSRLALFHCSVADQVRTSMKRFSPVDYCSIPISDGGMSCCHALGIGTL